MTTTTSELITPGAPLFQANHRWNQQQQAIQSGGHSRPRAPKFLIAPIPLEVGQEVKFLGDRRWWKVRAANAVCVVLTRSAAFGQGLIYTVIVWSEGRRGPHASWGHEATTDEGCNRIADDVAAGTLALSERAAISLDLEKIR